MSPKRKRSGSVDSNEQLQYDSNGDDGARLQYAYDEDFDSEAEQAFHTPHTQHGDGEDEEAPLSPRSKKQKISQQRPTRLNYVPFLTLRGHKRGVSIVKYSPDGKWIASCSADATIKIWNAATGALHQTLEGHLAGISAISWGPDSKVLASGSDDKLIRLWDVETGKCNPMPLVGHHNYVYSLAFSPKGNMLVSGSYDEAVFLWDVRTARLMRSLPAHSDPVSAVDFVRDGTLIASCSSDGLIRIWDTGTGQCLKTLVHEDNAAVTSVKFSPNGKYVLAATLDSSLRLWNYVEGRVLKTYQSHKNEKYSINACFGTYYAEERDMDDVEAASWAFVACGSEDGTTVLWDVSSKEVLQRLPGHEGAVLGVDVGGEDQDIVTCGIDRTVRVYKRQPSAPLSDGVQNGHAIVEGAESKEEGPALIIGVPPVEHDGSNAMEP